MRQGIKIENILLIYANQKKVKKKKRKKNLGERLSSSSIFD